uniref:Uncharacterized protein n=1 Tax=Solanum tuberosum TaxID=4113 RepID=M1DKG9_SOLTU
MICDHRLTQIETVNNKGKNIVEEDALAKPINLDPRQGILPEISIQDGDKEAMINNYLEEVERSLLLNITQYENSDTSMRSETRKDATDDIQEAQPVEATTSEDTLRKAEDLLRKLKEKDKL